MSCHGLRVQKTATLLFGGWKLTVYYGWRHDGLTGALGVDVLRFDVAGGLEAG